MAGMGTRRRRSHARRRTECVRGTATSRPGGPGEAGCRLRRGDLSARPRDRGDRRRLPRRERHRPHPRRARRRGAGRVGGGRARAHRRPDRAAHGRAVHRAELRRPRGGIRGRAAGGADPVPQAPQHRRRPPRRRRDPAGRPEGRLGGRARGGHRHRGRLPPRRAGRPRRDRRLRDQPRPLRAGLSAGRLRRAVVQGQERPRLQPAGPRPGAGRRGGPAGAAAVLRRQRRTPPGLHHRGHDLHRRADRPSPLAVHGALARGPHQHRHPAGRGPLRPVPVPRGGGRGRDRHRGARQPAHHLRPGPGRPAAGDPMSLFTALDVQDVRFPTSRHLDGSDAMNPDPDYSAAYLSLRTDAPDEGTALVFTIGRGNDVQSAAIAALAPHLVGRDVEEVLSDLGGIYRELISDSQLRWLGPEKGVMTMAIGAVINALWDLRARREQRPLWLTLASLTPEELLDLVDLRYLEDALSREEALEILRRGAEGKQQRIAALRERGGPADTTTPGWLGYSDEKLTRLLHEARDEGFEMVKLKVGADPADDERRMRIAREVMGPDYPIAMDANQRWGSAEAIEAVRALAP